MDASKNITSRTKNIQQIILKLTEILFLYLSVYLIIYLTSYLAVILNFRKITLYGGFIITGGMFIFPLIWEKWVKKISLKETGISIPEKPLTEIITGILFLAGIIFYNFLITPHLKVNSREVIFSLIHFLNCLTIALSEEFFFRSTLLRKFTDLWGTYSGLIITSLIFAFACHPRAEFTGNLIWRFPVAILLSCLYIRKKNLILPVIIHLILNILFMPVKTQ